MRRLVLIAALGAGAAAAAPLAADSPSATDAGLRREQTAQDPFRWRGRIPAGRSIEVKGVRGTIRALPATGNEVEVTAVRRGGRSNPGTVRIEVVPHEDGVTVCAVYPRGRRDSRWGGSEEPGRGREGEYNRCGSGEWRNLNVQDNDVAVDFTVRVPAGVRLVARNVSGDVEAEGLRSNVEARSVSGDIRLSTSGYGEASTVSGEIFAALGSAAWQDELDFSTVSGDITLELPARTSAEVRVETLSGEIDSDFPLEVERRNVRRRARGTLGSGGRELYLTTLSGDVRLVRSR
ncbi:MAG TPA: DUF4097 family beta strand repeat-containing protein [Longimicrobiaceae bacterium]|nr:DUF4097 family beta strand repeat-containing protein [Longimicrobiaceae bacterium]